MRLLRWIRERVRGFAAAWCGKDSRLSWSKLVTTWVLALATVGHPLEAVVAVVVIAAAHGPKLLTLALERLTMTATASDTRVESRSETVHVERQEIVARRVTGADEENTL
jgi:hypothetical protein